MKDDSFLSYWYQALASERGIELVCSDPEGTRAKLYAARKSAKDLDLDRISVCLSPFDPCKLWLVKRPQEGPMAQRNDQK